ncbi:hypothetical protein [Helicobacter labetoulli]|uniref:hypothetical protein n=1 Tax=Helicobacter labetoulli TaxID=2315333 RepID=UPI001FC95D6C|nr:hypothetical protein [Helicobacter labetoulli]
MIRFISIHKLRNATKQALCSLFISLLCFTFLGCEGQKTPQEQAIEGYMQGLFGGDLDKYLHYSSYGFALQSMGNANLANLFVAAESTRAKMLGGYKRVEILHITPDEIETQDSKAQNPQDSSSIMPTATALVKIHFDKVVVESQLHLVNYEQNRWIINSQLSLADTISSQLQH